MRGQSPATVNTIIGIILLVLIIGLGYWWYSTTPSESQTQIGTADEQAVRSVVTNFGKQLQMVPLTASSDDIASAVDRYYKPYIAPELLEKWEAAPANAPGRFTSSPWPDHIDILTTSKNPDGSYVVEGSVVEITSAEVEQGGSSDTYPVELKLENRDGKWLITDYARRAQ
ncbi:MAG TPA: hypothetical protein VHD31_02910 [Candidatus Paceibacterota bacterium]|nr:hypothetical protein [Candidatus Paceibacterota bacterium]